MRASQRGAALLMTFLMMLVLAGLALAVGVFSQSSLVTGQSQLLDKQTFFIAEAGVQRARQLIGTGERAVGGVCAAFTESLGVGQFTVSTAGVMAGPFTITSDGYVPSSASPVAHRQLLTQNITPAFVLGANLSVGAGVVAVASSFNGANVPNRARDANNATFWQAGTIGNNSWVGMDFGAATAVDEIIIRENGGTIVAITIEASVDGVAWTPVTCLTMSAAPAAGSNQVFTTRFNQQSSRFFRAFMSSVTAGQRAAVREMQVHNKTVTLTAGRSFTSF